MQIPAVQRCRTLSFKTLPYQNLTNQQWAGLGWSFLLMGQIIQMSVSYNPWIIQDGNPKWIMVDFGVIDEDSNGNEYWTMIRI